MGANETLVTHPDGWRTVERKPSAEALKAFYAQAYFQASHGTYAPDYSPTERRHRKLIADVLIAAVAEARGAALGDWLEVGCGEGWLLAAAGDAGYRVRGLDFSSEGLRRFHPQLEGAVSFGDAFDNLDRLIEDGARFDVVALEHVLEHVLDPEALLVRLPRLICETGVAVITVPNDFSPLQLAAREAGAIDRDFWVAPPQHLNYFNAESLRRLLTRLGFDPRVAYASFPIDWFLFHPAANYVADAAMGKAAHQARMAIDLLLAERGMTPYLDLAKALYACGAGRSLTVVAAPAR